MKLSMKLEDAQIVASLTSVGGTSPFERGNVVLRDPLGTFIQVDSYPDPETAIGRSIDEGGVTALVTAHQAVRHKDVAARPFAAAWSLRGDFNELHKLIAAFHLNIGYIKYPGTEGYIIREDSVALTLRDAWAVASRLQAIKAIKSNSMDAALGHARCALAFERAPSPEVIALIWYVCERLNVPHLAPKLMRKEWGSEFFEKVGAAWVDLERMFRA